MREMLKSPKIQEFYDQNPQVEFEFISRDKYRPEVIGTYINGYVKKYYAENKELDSIIENMERMKNSCKLPIFRLQNGFFFNPSKTEDGDLISEVFKFKDRSKVFKGNGGPICGITILLTSLKG